ncbi:uncharacterized protein BCR38DRAFT_489761 [Pseudomassariella vexata]|uniref:Uncharacterized protein n=1 Tax=Pseudomassariella vexata TaxID=1141098 RepID=A0A1Y2DEU0_9PEZI|nr:uncharacterized protein BCR38DRAFT_489761 [Pseudomassariella vexata]ORY57759.1 hypothetical protein BCR38DRAFT_489761 [Pseudomassariella vexata]
MPARAPILRSIDEDIDPVPVPPPLTYANSAARGRSLTRQSIAYMPPIPESPAQDKYSTTTSRALVPPSLAIIPPQTATMSPMPLSHSPTDDFIPIMHKRIPEKIHTRMPSPPPTPIDDDDDGFTPITPITPRSRGLLGRDALGIPVLKSKFSRSKSKKVTGSTAFDDLEPLSPSNDVARGVDGSGLPVPVTQSKSTRRTVWGVLEGWWDLGLLDRGKSLRRKG